MRVRQLFVIVSFVTLSLAVLEEGRAYRNPHLFPDPHLLCYDDTDEDRFF